MTAVFDVAAVLTCDRPFDDALSGRVASALRSAGAMDCRHDEQTQGVTAESIPQGLIVRFGVQARRLTDALAQSQSCLAGALAAEDLRVDHLSALTLRKITGQAS